LICDPYFYPSEDGGQCLQKSCPDFSYVDISGKECKKVECNWDHEERDISGKTCNLKKTSDDFK